MTSRGAAIRRDETSARPSRRRFLERGLIWLSAIGSGLLAILPIPRYLLAGGGDGEADGGETRAGTLSDLAREGALRVLHRGRPAIVLRGSGEPAAFSARCTHLGCVVQWDAKASQIRCPCHGARFGPEGLPLAGPTRIPLPRIPVRVRGDEIFLG